MIVNNPELRRRMREGRRSCEYCHKPFGPGRSGEVAHVFARGLGGGIDIPANLLVLGGPFQCACHSKNHSGKEPNRDDLLRVVSAREGCSALTIMEAIYRLRRAPRDGRVCGKCDGLGFGCDVCSGSGVLLIGGEAWTEG